MVRPADLSRRDFLRTAAAAGVMASVVPLERVRAGLHGRDLVGALVVDPGFDQIGWEHSTGLQVFIVCFECFKCCIERSWQLRNVCKLLGW